MSGFLPLVNNWVNIDYVFYYAACQQSYYQKQLMVCVSCLGCILQYFYKNHPHYSSTQSKLYNHLNALSLLYLFCWLEINILLHKNL